MIKKITMASLFVLALVLATGLLFQTISTKIDDAKYPPPGRIVDVNGVKMHINCSGNGSPTVILEAGMGASSLDWSLVQPQIAAFTKVCSYDRAGMGWSEESPNPRTSKNIVEELHALLTKENIPKPYILVGHSFGGIIIRQFASQFPEDVVGLVLVESSHELQNKKLPKLPEPSWLNQLVSQSAAILAPLGYPRLFQPIPINELNVFPKNIQEMYLAKVSTSKYFRATTRENQDFEKSLQQLENSRESIKNIPLIVITAGKSFMEQAEEPELSSFPTTLLKEIDQVWKDLQKNLVTKSAQGKQMIAEKSNHMIPWQEPEIIVEAVREEVNNYRSKQVLQ